MQVKSEHVDRLWKIKLAGEAACRAAIKDTFTGGAINWADLHCKEATRCEDEQGNITWTVLVEEADPVNPELQQYIARKILESEAMDVEVRTEW